ncbi:hypothetical protein [Legionella sp. W05-934-2]|jgi:hypothetical protein|uniref:hypothetical protein n=1 Tax=Legionella sp. W05-934-2 TaxID=1198649 RepID=UPI0034617C05
MSNLDETLQAHLNKAALVHKERMSNNLDHVDTLQNFVDFISKHGLEMDINALQNAREALFKITRSLYRQYARSSITSEEPTRKQLSEKKNELFKTIAQELLSAVQILQYQKILALVQLAKQKELGEGVLIEIVKASSELNTLGFQSTHLSGVVTRQENNKMALHYAKFLFQFKPKSASTAKLETPKNI